MVFLGKFSTLAMETNVLKNATQRTGTNTELYLTDWTFKTSPKQWVIITEVAKCVRTTTLCVCFPTWGVLLLTHSVFGRMSSHMIIHRARVCENEVESEAETPDYGEVRKLKDSRAHKGRAHQPSTAGTRAWWNPAGTKYLEASANQRWTWWVKTGGGGGQQVLILLHRPLGQQKDDIWAEDEGRWEPLDQSQITIHSGVRTPPPSTRYTAVRMDGRMDGWILEWFWNCCIEPDV